MVTKYFLALWMAFSLIGYSLPGYAQLPVDPTIVHGSAIIDTAGHHMTVTNSPNTILDWQSFSIGNDDSVYFQQQDATSMVLNRVTGNDPSQIFGSLGSNGSIWLLNPYGVLFGENARIDTAGLMASTLDISNIDFLAKQYHFNSTPVTGEVKNQGQIHTSLGGRVWLMGDRVQNEGLVETPGGQVVLAAGKSIELVDSGAPNVVVRVKAPENETINLGSLVASSGNVDLHGSIVNQGGIVRANSVGTDAAGHIVLKADWATLAVNSQTQADKGSVQMEASATLNNWGAISGQDITLTANEILQQGQVTAQGGNVILAANTYTYLDGLVDVSNAQGTGGNIRLTTDKLEGMAGGALRADGEQGGQIQVEGRGMVAFSSTLAATGNKQGGTIEVTGDRVYLLNADIDASGDTQGGTVHLGGGWQGGGDLPQAREVLVGVGSEVKANAGADGNADARGGEISVWSTQSSEHYGSLQAKGGGHIELASMDMTKNAGNIQTGTIDDPTIITPNPPLTINPSDNLSVVKKITSEPVDDSFGVSVALQGDLLAVGAAGDSSGGVNNSGAVYLFTGAGESNSSGLTFLSKLANGTNGIQLADSDFFGTAVALDGNHLAVGARGALLSGGNHGAVYLFNGLNTVGTDNYNIDLQQTIFSPPNTKEFDFFGTSVALDGNHLAVGAAGDSTNGRNQGAVYLYTVEAETTDFTQKGKLDGQTPVLYSNGKTSSLNLTNSGFFGWSLALDGDRMVVGAYGDDTGGTDRGAVYLFTGLGTDFNNGFTYQGKLASGTGTYGMTALENFDYFGWSVALNGDRMVVGAFGDDSPGGKGQGAVYLGTGVGKDFSGLTWTKTKSDTDGFGLSVALDGNNLAVGAIENSSDKGAMYLFNWLLQSATGNPTEQQATVQTAVQSTNAAASGTKAALDAHEGKVIDSVSFGASSTTSFGRLSLAQMSIAEMQQIIDYRREFKRNLFADAIYKLELDPHLSDVPLCMSLTGTDLSTCRISDTQRQDFKSNIANERQLIHQSKHKARIAILPQIERKFVVLFGIDQYVDKTIPSLENTISDAEAVGQLFADKLGYEIRVVKNATRADIVQTLNQLSIEMEKNDSLVIYYAGHGYLNEKTGNGYWIPADASANDPASWISNASISAMLAGIRAKQMVMISDSCYSGAFTREQRLETSGLNAKPEDILAKRSVVVMSSGGDEPVADEGRGGHSIFAWFLMQALRDIDTWKVGTNLFEQVQRDVRHSFPQNPQIGASTSAGHEKGGDYLFEFRQLE